MVEHVASDFIVLCVGERLGLVGDIGGIADVRRQIGQLARKADALGNRDGLVQSDLRTALAGEGERAQLWRRALLARLERGGLTIAAVIGGQCGSAHAPCDVAARHVGFGQIGHCTVDRQTTQCTDRLDVDLLIARRIK